MIEHRVSRLKRVNQPMRENGCAEEIEANRADGCKGNTCDRQSSKQHQSQSDEQQRRGGRQYQRCDQMGQKRCFILDPGVRMIFN
jgi:hypothetical protein